MVVLAGGVLFFMSEIPLYCPYWPHTAAHTHTTAHTERFLRILKYAR